MAYSGYTQSGAPRRRTGLIVVLVIAGLLVVCCLVAAVCVGGILLFGNSGGTTSYSSSTDWGNAIVLVYALDDPGGGLSAYVYNLEEHEIWLPVGRYYTEMKTDKGKLLAFNPLMIIDEADGKGAAHLKVQPSNPITSEQAAEQIETLARFLVGVDNVRLTYFDIFSNGFQDPLFAETSGVTWEDAERLLAALSDVGDAQPVIAAAQAFLARSGTAASAEPGQAGLMTPKAGLIDSVLSFFGLISEENDIARNQILQMYDAIKTPGEKEESFEALDERMLNGATNFDEFIEKVRSGEIKDLTSVRRDLMTFGPMEGIMQDLNPDSNRPGLENAHRVGAEAVKRGAELNVEVIKTTLSAAFPGIEEGFDYADKVNEWAEFIQQVYTDPLGALGDKIKDQATDAVKNQIKSQFQTLFPDMSEDDVDQFVDQIVDQVNETAVTLTEIEEEYVEMVKTQDAEETATEDETESASGVLTETVEPPGLGESTSEATDETETPEADRTEESEGSGPPEPEEEIPLPTELAESQGDQNKDENSDFVWDAASQCWNYVGPAYANYTWNCASQCFDYRDAEWEYDCATATHTYIGPGSDEWAWNNATGCWEYIQPNYYYNCATSCLEYIGPDAHLWYFDCRRNCLEYIGPKVDGWTWSCEWHRWVED